MRMILNDSALSQVSEGGSETRPTPHMNTRFRDGFRGFETIKGASQWRTLIALHATSMSLFDDELRVQVQMILSRTEQSRIARITKAWEQLLATFGCRLRSDHGVHHPEISGLKIV